MIVSKHIFVVPMIAVNYNPVANADDGSCLFAEGCMYEDACNFNVILEDDGSCEYAEALSYVFRKTTT